MASAPMVPSAGLAIAGTHLRAAISFELASYMVVVYDYVITLGDEVERVWKQPFTGATALFLLNRYGTLIEYGIVTTAFTANWSETACTHLYRFEGGGAILMIFSCELLMILRVYALYMGSIWVLTGLLALLAAQIVLMSLAASQGMPVPLPAPLAGPCILTGRNQFFAVFWIAPLVMDTVVFLLTLWKTREYFKRRQTFQMPLMQVFIRDGILYFAVIVSANLMNVIVYYSAVEDLKAICASFSQLVASVMISRLMLNLRYFRVGQDDDVPEPVSRIGFKPGVVNDPEDAFARSWVATHIVGNLGEELEDTYVSSGRGRNAGREAVELEPIREHHYPAA